MWGKDLLVEVVLIARLCKRGWCRSVGPVWAIMTWSHLLMTALVLYAIQRGTLEPENALRLYSRPLLGLAGALKWIVTFWRCRSFQTFSFGLRILPIVKALGEVVSFMFVMLFVFGASYQVSYAFTEEPMSNLVFNTYRMGFTGDLEDNLFLTDNTKFGEPQYFWEHFAYYVFAFVVMVSMTNIFIGVMSSAFDYHQERALQLFVRERIALGLRYALLRECIPGRPQEPEWLWFCYPLDDDENGVNDITFRSSLSRVKQDLSAQLSDISERLSLLEMEASEERAIRDRPKQPAEGD